MGLVKLDFTAVAQTWFRCPCNCDIHWCNVQKYIPMSRTSITSLMWDGRIRFMKVLLGSVLSGALAKLLSNQVRKTTPILLVNKSTRTADTKSHGQQHVKLGFETRIVTTEFWEIELERQWLERLDIPQPIRNFCPPFVSQKTKWPHSSTGFLMTQDSKLFTEKLQVFVLRFIRRISSLWTPEKYFFHFAQSTQGHSVAVGTASAHCSKE